MGSILPRHYIVFQAVNIHKSRDAVAFFRHCRVSRQVRNMHPMQNRSLGLGQTPEYYMRFVEIVWRLTPTKRSRADTANQAHRISETGAKVQRV